MKAEKPPPGLSVSSFILPPSSFDSMVRRLAAVMALLAFATCLVAGMGADNTFATSVTRALWAMAGSYLVALVIGAMAQKMLDENLAAKASPGDGTATAAGPPPAKEKSAGGQIPESKPGSRGR
jgi:hypothetical protein